MSLLVLLVALVYAITQQGLRIRSAAIDTTKATTMHQSLRLQMSQPVQSISPQKLNVTPKTAASVVTNGSSVVVRFQQKLRYRTTYTVTLRDVRNTQNSSNSSVTTVQYSFTTPPARFYYIKHDTKASDGFYSTTNDKLMYVEEKGEKVVLQAPHIDEYIRVGQSIIAVTSSRDRKTYQLKQITTQNNTVTDIATPRFETIRKLRSAPDGVNYGFIGTTTSDKQMLQSHLYLYDMNTGKQNVVKNPDGKPMQIYDWYYGLSGTSVIVSSDDMLFSAPIFQEKPIMQPLGQAGILGGISHDGRRIITTYLNKDREIIDIRNGNRAPLDNETLQTRASIVRFLHNSPGFVAHMADTVYESRTVKVRSVQGKYQFQTLYHTKAPSYATDVDTSPNDQYVVISQAKFAHNTKKTVIVDAQSGAIWRELDGDMVTWL